VFNILALQQDYATSFDASHRAVPKSDGSMNASVELGEHLTLPGHVVCCARVEYLAHAISTLLVAELNEELALI
jgi:hypothetical protein